MRTRPWEPHRTVARIVWFPRDPIPLPGTPRVGEDEYRSYVRTQIALMKDMLLLSDLYSELHRNGRLNRLEATETFHGEGDRRQWLKDHFRVEIIEGTELVRVSISGGPPEELMTLINSLVKKCEEMAKQEFYRRMEVLIDSRDELKDRLMSRRKSVAAQEASERKAGTGPSPELVAIKEEIETSRRFLRQLQAALELTKLESKFPRLRALHESQAYP